MQLLESFTCPLRGVRPRLEILRRHGDAVIDKASDHHAGRFIKVKHVGAYLSFRCLTRRLGFVSAIDIFFRTLARKAQHILLSVQVHKKHQIGQPAQAPDLNFRIIKAPEQFDVLQCFPRQSNALIIHAVVPLLLFKISKLWTIYESF